MRFWRVFSLLSLVLLLTLRLSGQTTLLTDAGATYTNTDGPTFDNYGPVDISSCATVIVSFDYSFSFPWENSGNMESADECGAFGDPCLGDPSDPTAGGCNMCWDFLFGEFSVDGNVVDSELIGDTGTTDAEQTGTINFSFCNDAGASSAELDISTQTWAASESVTFSNISIICYESVPTATATPDEVCSGEIVDLDATVNDNAAVSSSTWTGPGSLDDASSLNTVATTAGGGTETYTITTVDPLGCATTDEVDVTVNTTPVASLPPPVIVCYSLIPLTGEILNLTEVIESIRNFDASLTVNWFFDMDAMNPLDPTDPGDLITLITNLQTTVYATVSDGTCESAPVPVSVDLNTYPDNPNGTLNECPGASGEAEFTLTDADDQFNGGDPSLVISYHGSSSDAEDNVDPILGTVSTPTDLTLFVRIENAAGCASVAELELIVDAGTTANPASLEACDNGSGQADFDLTTVESTILGGQSGTVLFYEDLATTIDIPNPGNYTDGTGTIYAVIDDGSGCVSPPVEVDLTVVFINPGDVFLTFDPTSGCGNTVISMTLNTPFDPPGEYTFNVSFGPVSTGPVSTGDFIGFDGDTPFQIGINEDYVFVLNSVTGPGPLFCEIIFSPGIEYIIPIADAPDAFTAEITACADEFGEAIYNLTLLESTINGNTGFAVDFYEDIGLTSLITDPSAYLSAPGTIFAVVDAGGGCVSDPVPISLFVEEAPDPVDFTLDITSSCTDTDVTLTFSLPNGDAFNFDLLITDGNGTSVSSYSGITNFSMLTFNVTETTTFSIEEIQSSFGCFYTLDPTPSQTITIGSTGAMPAPASLSACDNGSGQATFDLTSVDNTVNGGSGETVLWFEDAAGNTPIGTPASYLSGGGTVYAALLVAGCVSATVEVDLTILDLPDISINLDQGVTCSSSATAAISVNTNGNGPFDFDWNDDTYDGLQTITDLPAGFYAVTVSDGNNCEAFADITITDPPAVSLDCSVVSDETTAGANDGQASFTFNDGTAPYEAVLTGPVNVTESGLATNTFVFTDLPPGNYSLTVTDDNGCSADCMFTIDAANCDLSIMLDGEDVSCHGFDDGEIEMFISNGAGPLSFDWSDDQYDGQSNLFDLPPGIYSVTVTDANSCTDEAQVTITEPDPLNLECRANGLGQGSGPDSYTFIYSGGTPFYILDLAGPVNISFTENVPGEWNTTVLPAGNYTFTLTDENGCAESCSFTITQSCDLTLQLDGTDPNCAGEDSGSLDLVITSSEDIVLIDWNDDSLDGQTNPTGLLAGTYTVTVFDDLGCEATANFVLTDPDAIILDCSNIADPTTSMSNDGQADISINGGAAPYTITWSGPVSGSDNLAMAGTYLINSLAAGSYTVVIEDSDGCMTSCTFDLAGANCDLSLDLQGTNPNCAGEASGSLDLMIDGSFPIVTIDWNEDSFDGIEDHIDVPAGMFEVTVTDNQGCVASTTLTLVDPPALFLNCAQTTDPSTNTSTDGEVTVVIAGGSAGYTISWTGPVSGSTMAATPGSYNINNLIEGSYTITLEDDNGCTTTCDFVLTGLSVCTFDLAFTAADETCPGATDGNVLVEPNGGTPDYTYSWSTMASTPGILDLGAGTYIVTVTDANSCVAIDSIMIGVANPAPSLLAGAGGNICRDSCFNLPLQLSGQAPFTVDYTIDAGGIMIDLQATLTDLLDTVIICPAIEAIPFGPFSVTFTQISDVNCQATLAETVSFEYLEPGIEDFMSTICLEDTLVVGGEIFHQANPNGTVIIPQGASNGCDSIINITLDFFPESTFDLGQTICLEDTLFVGGTAFHFNNPTGSVLLENASVNGCDSTVNVDLSFFPVSTFDLASTICPEDTITVGSEQFHLGNPSGMVVLDNASSNGCDSTINVNLSFFPASEVAITDNLCQGDTIIIAGQEFYSGMLSDTIILDNAASNGCDSTIFVNLVELLPGTSNVQSDLCAGDTLDIGGVIFTEDALQGTILLDGQASNGCDSLIFVDLNLIPLTPTPLDAMLCPGDSLVVGDSVLTVAGMYDILLENAAVNGCDSLVQVELDILPAITESLTGTFCADESVTVGNETFDIGNPSGTVIIPDGSVNGCDSTVLVDLTFVPAAINDLDTILCFGESLTIGTEVFDMDNPGGIVVLPNAASSGCDSTIFVNTSYQPELTASLGPDTTLCGDQSLDGVLELTPGPLYSFELESSTGFQLSIDDVSGGQYNFALGQITQSVTVSLNSITANDGCPITILDDEATIQFSDAQVSLASIGGSAGSDISCADVADGTLQANVTGGIGPFTYAWNTGDDEQILDGLGEGNYSITITDLPGCTSEASITLTAPAPVSLVVEGNSAGCFGSANGALNITEISGGTAPYEFSLDNEFFQQLDTNILIPNLAAGPYTVFVQDANDCQSSFSAAVPEALELQLDLGDDEVIQIGDSILIKPLIDFVPASWTWTPTNGISQPDTFITYVAPLETTVYQLEMLDGNGCVVSDLIRIIVEKDVDVFIPTAFSPDGDGTNDIFMIFAGQGVEEVESFQIFDRWGNQVFFKGPFQPNDPLFGWDGTHNGELLNAAVFVYFAEVRLITGETVMLEGEVLLMK